MNNPNSHFHFTRRHLLAGVSAGAALAAASPAAAVLRLDVTQGNVQPMPIALPDFLMQPGLSDPGMGRTITQIIH